MTMQALLDNGDEVLVPAPDYPLWTASTSLAGGTPVHYLCDETQGWNARHRRHRVQDHRPHQGARRHQPEQPDRRGVHAAKSSSRWPNSRASTSCCCSPTRSTTRSSTTTPSTSPGDAGARPAVPDVQRAVEGLPGGRLPLRLAGDHRPEGARQQLPRGHQPAGQHAAVPERACAARDSGGARRASEHRGPGAARRAAARTARHRVDQAQRDSRA